MRPTSSRLALSSRRGVSLVNVQFQIPSGRRDLSRPPRGTSSGVRIMVMETSRIAELAGELAAGKISLDNFLQELAKPRTADLGEVQLDLDRRERCGYPEVVFGQGKSVATIAKIFRRLLAAETDVLATRIAAEPAAAELSREFPAGRYNPVGRTFTIAAEARAAPVLSESFDSCTNARASSRS